MSNDHFSFAFNLVDRFGEHGLICVVILKKQSSKALFIDTWQMSCRVLKRGMEKFVLNHIVDFSKKNNYEVIIGEYIQTNKNNIVKDHYSDLGFDKNNNDLILSLDSYNKLNTYIKTNNHE